MRLLALVPSCRLVAPVLMLVAAGCGSGTGNDGDGGEGEGSCFLFDPNKLAGAQCLSSDRPCDPGIYCPGELGPIGEWVCDPKTRSWVAHAGVCDINPCEHDPQICSGSSDASADRSADARPDSSHKDAAPVDASTDRSADAQPDSTRNDAAPSDSSSGADTATADGGG